MTTRFHYQEEELTLNTIHKSGAVVTADLTRNHHFTRHRNLIEETRCESIDKLATTFNEDENVPPYVGIMFEIQAKIDLEVLTFEVDVRTGNETDLSVEVFTKEGGYKSHLQEEEWESVSISQMVPIGPKGSEGAIIPVADFSPVHLPMGSKRSFYISMRGPYIDFTVDALNKAGELFKSTPEMSLFAGSGFSEPHFPAIGIDKIVNPQFSGVVHYKKVGDCDEMLDLTSIDFQFLLSGRLLPPEAVDVINASVDSAIDEILSRSPELREYQSKHGLKKLPKTETNVYDYNGGCPSEFGEDCPSAYLHTSVTFQNSVTLEREMVKYHVYRSVSDIVRATASAVSHTFAGKKMVYIGYESVAVTFSVVLVGVPPSTEMNDLQRQYFGRVTSSFLDKQISNDHANVFLTKVEEQYFKDTRVRRLRTLVAGHEESVVELQGTIYGAQAAALSAKNFAVKLAESFLFAEDEYINNLKSWGLKPGTFDRDAESYEYFRSVRGAVGTTELLEHSSSVPEETNHDKNDDSFPILLTIVGSILGLVAIIALGLLIMNLIKSAREKKEKEETRRRRRENEKRRGNRRQSRPNESRKKDNKDFNESVGSGLSEITIGTQEQSTV